jgi:type I restriction enzyme, S subunit
MTTNASSHWLEGCLGDHATVKARLGWKGLKAEEYILDGPVFLAAPNLRRGRIDFDRVDHVPEWRYNESPEIQLKIGDVLLVKDGSTLGISAIVKVLPTPTTVNGSIAVIRTHESLKSDFLFYFINGDSFQKLIWVKRAGLGVPHLFQADLRKFRISIPSSSEQRRMAEILSTVDETIQQTEALIAKYQRIRVGLMNDLFTRGVTPDGRLRPTRAEAPSLYKEFTTGWIPKEWTTATLSDLRRTDRAHLKTGPFGSSLKSEHWVETGHPVITIGALGEGEFIESELLFVADATARRLWEYQLVPGDIVFSRVADVGRSAVIGDRQRGWIMSSNLMRLSVDPGRFLPDLLQMQLAYDGRVRAQIRSLVNAGGRDVANSKILNRLVFARPDADEQKLITHQFRALKAKCDSDVAYLHKLTFQKHGLMHDLLTGRVRVKTAEAATP